MPLLKSKAKPEAEAPAEEAVEGVTREEFDALVTRVTEQEEKFEALLKELNEAGEDAPADDVPAEEAGEETSADDPAEEDAAPAEEATGEVSIPSVDEIKKADAAQLKEWRKTLFDEADAKRPLEEIRKELLEVAKASEAGEATEEATEEAAEEAPAEEAGEDDDPAPAKGKKTGTNGNVFGLIQDAKTKLVSGVKMKPVLQCTTDLDKVVRLANTYACFFDEKKCLCKTGDKKAIAECWKEYLNDPETKKLIAKEKGAKPAAPAPAAKKPLLKKKK